MGTLVKQQNLPYTVDVDVNLSLTATATSSGGGGIGSSGDVTYSVSPGYFINNNGTISFHNNADNTEIVVSEILIPNVAGAFVVLRYTAAEGAAAWSRDSVAVVLDSGAHEVGDEVLTTTATGHALSLYVKHTETALEAESAVSDYENPANWPTPSTPVPAPTTGWFVQHSFQSYLGREWLGIQTGTVAADGEKRLGGEVIEEDAYTCSIFCTRYSDWFATHEEAYAKADADMSDPTKWTLPSTIPYNPCTSNN